MQSAAVTPPGRLAVGARLRRIAVMPGVPVTAAMRAALAGLSQAPVEAADVGDKATVECLVAGWQHHVDEALVEAFPSLRLVLLRATSRDRVDEAALRARGISLASLGRYGDEATAEFVVGEILRHFRAQSQGTLPREASGRALGIVGMGAVGQLVGRAGVGLGMNVLYSARTVDETPRLAGAQQLTSEGVLARADVVTVHTPPYVRALSRGALERSRCELLVLTTLGLPLPEEDVMSWAAGSGRRVVVDLCAAQGSAGKLREAGVVVREAHAARSQESVRRAEAQLLNQLWDFLGSSRES
jgi:hypothetical protein